MSKPSIAKQATQVKVVRLPKVAAPVLPYRPRDPKLYRPNIGVIGCGGITKWHLTAYKKAGYNVTALCDIDIARAEMRRNEYYPDACMTDDHRQLLARDDIEVVDITTHPPQRPPIIEDVLRAKARTQPETVRARPRRGRAAGRPGGQMGVRLAVNQNARWAPHFSYIREAVRAGLLGAVDSVHCDVHWDHSWVKGTAFETVHHLILYDFAIHWFDFLATVMRGTRTARVRFDGPPRYTVGAPPLLAQAMVDYEAGQATLIFDGFTRFERIDRTLVIGTQGAIRSVGDTTETQRVELTTASGIARPRLQGTWFPDGFHGTMGELMSAIAENREPTNSARENLDSLELCFAAVASAERGDPVKPGSVRKLPAE